MPRREAGNAMGVVSLGAGLFGFFGPQMLGILRDWTGSFAAGFYMVAIADVLTLGLIVLLYRMTRATTAAGRHGERLKRSSHMTMRQLSFMHRRDARRFGRTSAPAVCRCTIGTPRTRATGDQRRQYLFTPTGQQLPYRLFVPPTWDGKTSLPIILMLHGGGANENTLHGHVRRVAAEARGAARLHRRVAARVHAARRVRQSAAAAGGVSARVPRRRRSVRR